MFFKKLAEKLILFFKRLFGIDEISDINALRDISLNAHECYKAAKSKIYDGEEDIIEFTKHLKTVEMCADRMRFTCTPEIFISAYAMLTSAIENACKTGVNKDLSRYADQIKNMVNSLPKSYTECEGADNLYYSVTFRSKRKSYYYLAGNRKYKVGQYVIAPAGVYMEPAVVRIVRIERFDGTPPMPADFLKTIKTSAI